MATLERHFIDGMLIKTLIIGLLMSVLAGLGIDTSFALAVISGLAITLANLLVLRFVVSRMIGVAKRGSTSTAPWTFLWLLKIVLLFYVTYLLIARWGVSAVGFALGFSSFLPAMLWQLAVTPSDVESDSGDDGEVLHDIENPHR